MREQVQIGTRTLETFRLDVGQYLAQQQRIQNLAATVDCGIVQVNLQVQYHISRIICCSCEGHLQFTAYGKSLHEAIWLLLLHTYHLTTYFTHRLLTSNLYR